VRAFLTGGTGFIGGALARLLRARGDEVVALVRDPSRGRHLRHLGCTLVEGDLDDAGAIRRGLEGCDAAFHAAAIYRIGVRAREAPELERVNVGGTERVLDVAAGAGTPRVVHVSSVTVLGNTRGAVVDETYGTTDPPLSVYDATKSRAHALAVEHGARIAMPCAAYGPGDHSQLGAQIAGAMRGRLPYLAFPELGVSAVHVDDVAEGILLVHDRGAAGEAYVLGGERTTMRGLVDAAARVAGRRPPRLTMPTAAVRLLVPFAPLLGRLGIPPNLRETIASAAGVTYWASDAKAREQLGYTARGLGEGLLDLYAAEHAAR
jgi:dihydroflavonol-4-reductase